MRRATATSSLEPLLLSPAMTIPPSAKRAMPLASSSPDPTATVAFPSESNAVSRAPALVRRTTAMSSLVPLWDVPATRMSPSVAMATARPRSLPEPIATVTLPSESNAVSRAPALVSRTTATSSSEPLWATPATTMSPSDAMDTAWP